MNDAAVAVRQAVLDVAEGGVHEDAVLIPRTALDADVLVEGVVVLQVLACHEHIVLGHERNILAVRRPDRVPHATRHGDLVDHLTGREVVEDHLLLALENDPVIAAREDALRGHRRLELLRQLVLQAIDSDGAVLLQDGESVPRREAHGLRVALLGGHMSVTCEVRGAHEQVVATVVLRVVDQDVGLRRVVGVVLQVLHARRHHVRGRPAGRQLVAGKGLVQVHELGIPLLHYAEAAAVAHR
mmetsp:Transcript_35164/g.101265  ORF Transcript_35164/g.101265 Transcript_35164/m.101265 type:complete len:242 (-) Transcript_35164:1080-1805(-)